MKEIEKLKKDIEKRKNENINLYSKIPNPTIDDPENLKAEKILSEWREGNKKITEMTARLIKLEQKERIEQIIRDNKIDVEGITEYTDEWDLNLISIQTGSNEGYFVKIQIEKTVYSLRFHDRKEALKTLNIMMCLLPNK